MDWTSDGGVSDGVGNNSSPMIRLAALLVEPARNGFAFLRLDTTTADKEKEDDNNDENGPFIKAWVSEIRNDSDGSDDDHDDDGNGDSAAGHPEDKKRRRI